MATLPVWARKPKHKEKVIPTSKGWVVESTGEVLVSMRDLDKKLENLSTELSKLISNNEFISVESAEMEVDKDSDTQDNLSSKNGESSKIGDKLENQVLSYLDSLKNEESKTIENSETTEENSESKKEAEDEQPPKKTTKRRGRPPKAETDKPKRRGRPPRKEKSNKTE